MVAILDFLYFGETSIFQENLDSFLVIANELEVKGLMGTKNEAEMKEENPKEVLEQPESKSKGPNEAKPENLRQISNVNNDCKKIVTLPGQIISSLPDLE